MVFSFLFVLLSCLMVAISPAMDAALLSAFFLFSGSASDKSFECGISSAQVGVLIHINLILGGGGLWLMFT